MGNRLGMMQGFSMNKPMKSLMAALALLAVSTQLWAHHGVAIYDAAQTVIVKGTVVDFHFANPHTMIYLDVKERGGDLERWEGELTSPNLLERLGWSNHSLKMGDQVTVSGHPAKNGAKSLWVTKIVLPDGHELDADMK